MSGTANLIRYDYNGNKTIIGHFTQGEIFGEAFYPENTNNELFVEAKEQCTVIFFNYDYITKECPLNCEYQKEIESKMNKLIMKKTINLNMRIELLTKKNIKDKLLSYFNIMASKNQNKTFSIPFTLTELADYLSVDRSAMMREISHLKNDGIINKNKNIITLLI